MFILEKAFTWQVLKDPLHLPLQLHACGWDCLDGLAAWWMCHLMYCQPVAYYDPLHGHLFAS